MTYKYYPLWKTNPPIVHEEGYRWNVSDHKWTRSWKDTVEWAEVLEPRWVKGRLIWLLQIKGMGKRRWLVEIFDNGEPDLHLLQAMTAAKWVEDHRKKHESNKALSLPLQVGE